MKSIRCGSDALRGCCLQYRPAWQCARLLHLRGKSQPESRRHVSQMSGSAEDSSLTPMSDDQSLLALKMVSARPLPASPSYFSLQPRFSDSFLLLQQLLRRYGHLPMEPGWRREQVAWRTLDDYKILVGEKIKATHYATCLDLVKRLHAIHPKLKTKEVIEALEPFRREIQPNQHRTIAIPIDKFGRALGTGRRKTSVARAWVVEGTGEVLVNGKSLADVFGRVHDRESAMIPLKATQRLDKYNVWALVNGGGTTGQAEALTLAIAKALMAHEPMLKAALRQAGCLTRDPRMVERKKPGHVKARKMPAWVKR